MYMVNVYYGVYGDYDAEPELATVETLGTYESLDEACEVAKSKFAATMKTLAVLEFRCRKVKESRYDYYVVYGYYYPELGGVLDEDYCEVRVAEMFASQTPQQGGR